MGIMSGFPPSPQNSEKLAEVLDDGVVPVADTGELQTQPHVPTSQTI